MQGREALHQFSAQRREAVTIAGQQLDEAGLAQLGQPGLHHQRAIVQLPDDPQGPAAAEQIE
jgi:hypothetical protein